MNDDRSTRRALDRALAEAERALRTGHGPDETALDELEQLAAADPARAKRLQKRLSRVFAFAQLRAREVPEGWLDGLYEDVYAASSEPYGRARMSLAFLDAPRSLQRWRYTAVAACLLLAAGVGWNSLRGDDDVADTAGVRSLYDADHPLNNMLERETFGVDEPEAPGASGDAVPVLDQPRRARSPFGGRVWFRIGSSRGNGNGAAIQVERKGGQEEN